MKIKKWFLSVILFFGLFACCPQQPDYWSFETFNFRLIDRVGVLENRDIVQGDSLWLILRFDAILVQNESLQFEGLMNSVYGWSCEEAGELGLVDKIVSCTFSSDQEFSGIPAGSSLNHLFTNNGLDVDNWVLQSGDFPLPLVGETDFLLKKHPGNTVYHNIKVEFELESGIKIESMAKSIKWD